MTKNTPNEAADKSVSPDFHHRFFIAYDAEVGHQSKRGYQTFSSDKPTTNPHDIDYLCDEIAKSLAEKYHIPMSARNVALNNIIYLGYQDDATWTQNDHKKDADENPA